jgi:hypothetical protein
VRTATCAIQGGHNRRRANSQPSSVRARDIQRTCASASFATAPVEPAWHRRERRARSKARGFLRACKAADLLSGHHGSAPPMYQGQWYGKGNGWDAYAALAAQVQLQQLATGKGWGRNLDVGYKGGKKGKAAWAKGGKPVAGMPMWSGHDRRTQWQCPSCRGRDGNPTLNREYRVCCHKCGESKPNGDKGRGKGVGQGVNASAHRGHSPIGADGQRPMLGKSGMQEGTKVRGRSPLGSLQGINDRRGQSPPDPQ